MQYFILPTKTTNVINRTVRDLIWGSTADKRKIHLPNWFTISQPKKHGGIQINDSKLQNHALLPNLAWSFHSILQSLFGSPCLFLNTYKLLTLVILTYLLQNIPTLSSGEVFFTIRPPSPNTEDGLLVMAVRLESGWIARLLLSPPFNFYFLGPLKILDHCLNVNRIIPSTILKRIQDTPIPSINIVQYITVIPCAGLHYQVQI